MDFNTINQKKEQSFTSTGDKILAHKDVIDDLRNKRNHPVVLHIMPTEKCNLRCVFCSVAQRGQDGKLHDDLTMNQIKSVIEYFKSMGLKAIILSGGGEPAMYPQINELISFCADSGLEIGMISNGTILTEKIAQENIDKLTWLRVSINSLDYLPDIKLPNIKSTTTLGFSYIWNPLTNNEILEKIKKKIAEIKKTTKVEYVRLLPDCNLSSEDLEAAHKKLRAVTESLGAPFFHQYKIHGQPSECHLGRVHPVLYTDGYIYPCDSLVLNSPDDDKKFHQDYALCHASEIKDFYNLPISGSLIDTHKCPKCVFRKQNELLTEIIADKIDLPEPPQELKHINFI